MTTPSQGTSGTSPELVFGKYPLKWTQALNLKNIRCFRNFDKLTFYYGLKGWGSYADGDCYCFCFREICLNAICLSSLPVVYRSLGEHTLMKEKYLKRLRRGEGWKGKEILVTPFERSNELHC